MERRPLLKHPCDGLFFYLSSKRNRKFKHLGPVARSLVSANRWLRGIKMYRFPWYLTLVSTNHASSNPGLVQTKPMGENTITHIMKVSVAGFSLKESEKRVYGSLCKKNNSQEAEKSKDCKFRIYRQCHRPQRYKFP